MKGINRLGVEWVEHESVVEYLAGLVDFFAIHSIVALDLYCSCGPLFGGRSARSAELARDDVGCLVDSFILLMYFIFNERIVAFAVDPLVAPLHLLVYVCDGRQSKGVAFQRLLNVYPLLPHGLFDAIGRSPHDH